MKGFSKNSSVVNIGSSPDCASLRGRTSTERGTGEDGAILILALAYLLIISLVVAMLSTWASNDLNNSSKFSSANSLTVAASGMTDLSIQYMRYNPLITNNQLTGAANPSPLIACWGGSKITGIPSIDGYQVAVWCSTVWQPLIANTRTVTFYACPISVLAAACQGTNVLLTAVVTYDDYPPAPARSAPIQDLCTLYCGQGMTIDSWKWGGFTTGSVTGIAASMTFTNEPSDTNADSSTQAAVIVKDSSNSPVAGDLVTLVEQSGPSLGITAPSSTLTAMTNSSGVAVFSNIVPQFTGNYTVTAVDGSASATSTNFVVGQERDVITPSNPPPNATQNGTPYTVTATSQSGVQVVIADTTGSVCKLTGNQVTFLAQGTCTITFNDPGNANFAPAQQITQSFPVGGLSISQVGIALATKTPNESTTTNDQITVTLENSVGTPEPAPAGGVSVVLSDVASGFFAPGSGTTPGTPTLTLNFPSGTMSMPAYFGGQTIGPDTITAVNGTSVWGSAALTVLAGTPTQVVITPSPTTTGVSSTTNTALSLQLEDSGGNFSSSNTAITLMLSAPSGYFATSAGVSGTPTLSVTFPIGVSSETAYFGDQASGSDTISAKNGTTWGTSTMTLTAGVATQVQITLNPASPGHETNGKTNTTVTLQLEDQFGNAVQTSGVVLTLSSTGAGFISKTPNSAGSTSMALNSTSNAGVATGYFGDPTKQSVTITATGPGISTTSSPITVN